MYRFQIILRKDKHIKTLENIKVTLSWNFIKCWINVLNLCWVLQYMYIKGFKKIIIIDSQGYFLINKVLQCSGSCTVINILLVEMEFHGKVYKNKY